MTKLSLLLPAFGIALVAPAWQIAASGLVVLGTCTGAGIGVPMARRLLVILLPVSLGVFAVHGFLLPSGDGVAMGPVQVYPAGLARAALILSRLFLLLATGLAVVMSTRLPDLADALEAKGLPASLAFLVTAPLAMAETVAAEARAVKEALQVRGLALRGGPRQRLRAISLIVLAVARAHLADAGPRSRALDGRGFRSNSRRTLLHEPPDCRAERIVRWSAAGFALAALIWIAVR